MFTFVTRKTLHLTEGLRELEGALLLAIQSLYSSLCFLSFTHGDKSKAAGTTGIAIPDNDLTQESSYQLFM